VALAATLEPKRFESAYLDEKMDLEGKQGAVR
jgi:hypothetical protein